MASNGNTNNGAGEGKDAHHLLNDVVSDGEVGSSTKKYAKWADNYEADMRAVKYFGPEQLFEHFDKFNIPKDAKVLDVCAGTGGIGRECVKRGITDVHAIDGTEAMLVKAKAEGNYKSYKQLLFLPDSKLPYEDHEFDAVLLAGVFAPGHLPLVAMREAARVTKVGGLVAFICCDPKHYETMDPQFENGGFYKIVNELKDNGIWKDHEGFPVSVPYIEYSDGFVFAFDVTGPK